MSTKTTVKIISGIIALFAILTGGGSMIKKNRNNVKDEMPELPPANIKYRDVVKRYIDLAIAVPITLLAAIPMAIVAAAIKIDSPGPVIFKQDRIGKNGKILKF